MKVPLSWIREFVDVHGIGRRDRHADGRARPGARRPRAARRRCRHGFRRDGQSPGLHVDDRHRARDRDGVPVCRLRQCSATAEAVAARQPRRARSPITIEDPELCGRYVGAVADVTRRPVAAVDAGPPHACGVRPISNIVDITNYVLLELGQPMHAFDLAKLRRRRDRRAPRAGRRDASRRSTARRGRSTADMLVIADAERAQAIGGVMGGADSEVTGATTRIVFEAAWFKPPSVRATSKKLGLKTEASIALRARRGSSRRPPRAMARALRAARDRSAPARSAARSSTSIRRRISRRRCVSSAQRISGLLGMDVPDDEVERHPDVAGFRASGHLAKATADWQRGTSLARVAGGHAPAGRSDRRSRPPSRLRAPAGDVPRRASRRRRRPIRASRAIAASRTALLGMGFSEAITFAFIEADGGRAVPRRRTRRWRSRIRCRRSSR